MKRNLILAFMMMLASAANIRSDSLLIFGATVKTKAEVPIRSECLICNQEALYLFSWRRWGTLFFIPVIPVLGKNYYVGCIHCKQCYKLKSRINIQMLLDEAFEGDLRAIIKTSDIDIIATGS